MTLYRAEATRRHSGKASVWKGKWRKDPRRAVAQAAGWREREPLADIRIVTDAGAAVTLEELLTSGDKD